LIAEGESGTHYRLCPPPWNTFSPYGDLERDQYDAIGNAHAKIAKNTLRYTDHEPISRFFLLEETWPKKYNLPDHLWAARFDEEKDPHSYFWLKATFDSEGMVLQGNGDYITYLTNLAVTDNPRLKADSLRGKPFYAVDPSQRTTSGSHSGHETTENDLPWLHPNAN
jgi:hypothetical protein